MLVFCQCLTEVSPLVTVLVIVQEFLESVRFLLLFIFFLLSLLFFSLLSFTIPVRSVSISLCMILLKTSKLYQTHLLPLSNEHNLVRILRPRYASEHWVVVDFAAFFQFEGSDEAVLVPVFQVKLFLVLGILPNDYLLAMSFSFSHNCLVLRLVKR